MNSRHPKPSAELPPITPDRLRRTSDRVHGHLERETVLPLPSIQYAISETGPIVLRLDPRELRATLRLLANTPRPAPSLAHGPWEPRPGIYVTPGLGRENAKYHAEISAATKEDQLRVLTDANPENRGAALATAIAESVSAAPEIEEVDADMTETLGGDVRWSAAGARFQVQRGRKQPAASVWVTSDLSWLFPDDPRLWRHLIHCLESQYRPIIIARKVAVSTFPMLKRLGAFALQLHHLYLPGDPPESPLARRAMIPGPPIARAEEVGSHNAIRKNLRLALPEDPSQPTGASEAIRLGARLGLDNPLQPRLHALRQWTGSAPVAMPAPWKAQLTRYERWSNIR